MHWHPYLKAKWNILKKLKVVYKHDIQDAVFEDEIKRCEILKKVFDFFSKVDRGWNWKDKKYCPICNSRRITYCDIPGCKFEGLNNPNIGKETDIRVYHCCKCGFIETVNKHYRSDWEW